MPQTNSRLCAGIVDCCRVHSEFDLRCNNPEVPANGMVEFSSTTFDPGTEAKYACEKGFDLLGMEARLCQADGTWSNMSPLCALEVGNGKPAIQSSTSDGRGAALANDGRREQTFNKGSCSTTDWQNAPWWSVNLLMSVEVTAIRILNVAENCCAHGATVDIFCTKPIRGQYVTIQILPEPKEYQILNLCEVSIFALNALDRSKCPEPGDLFAPVPALRVFEDKCYLFINDGAMRKPWSEARRQCMTFNGKLAEVRSKKLEGFLGFHLDAITKTAGRDYYWIGAKRYNTTSDKWIWSNGGAVNMTFWGPAQPNNFRGNQHCVGFNWISASEAGLEDWTEGWYWYDVQCERNHSFICQYDPVSCSVPPIPAGSLLIVPPSLNQVGFQIGDKIEYRCQPGHVMMGEPITTCLKTGQWNDLRRYCLYVNCALPATLRNGQFILLDNATHYGGRVERRCKPNYMLEGPAEGMCLANGTWSGADVKCKRIHCGKPIMVQNATHKLDRRSREDKAYSVVYTCTPGYSIYGPAEVHCLGTGKWSAAPPICIGENDLAPPSFSGVESEAPKKKNSKDIGIAIGIALSVLLLLSIVSVLLILYRKKILKIPKMHLPCLREYVYDDVAVPQKRDRTPSKTSNNSGGSSNGSRRPSITHCVPLDAGGEVKVAKNSIIPPPPPPLPSGGVSIMMPPPSALKSNGTPPPALPPTPVPAPLAHSKRPSCAAPTVPYAVGNAMQPPPPQKPLMPPVKPTIGQKPVPSPPNGKSPAVEQGNQPPAKLPKPQMGKIDQGASNTFKKQLSAALYARPSKPKGNSVIKGCSQEDEEKGRAMLQQVLDRKRNSGEIPEDDGAYQETDDAKAEDGHPTYDDPADDYQDHYDPVHNEEDAEDFYENWDVTEQQNQNGGGHENEGYDVSSSTDLINEVAAREGMVDNDLYSSRDNVQ
ncbi:PREDICTED: uncharacterized protein LOC106810245 [Priapulus caudatus]|uniref:Uncharacterized protein LOC106810245 n=1 Tax=Priapulus caudatus TaxID=37621 RepID=A0ABM1EA01_PRICU|nr:PREDICTED: uncharacterized protein LOC106810245 [Priapulus caudatus]